MMLLVAADLKYVWMSKRLASAHVSFEDVTELFHDVWVFEHVDVLQLQLQQTVYSATYSVRQQHFTFHKQ